MGERQPSDNQRRFEEELKGGHSELRLFVGPLLEAITSLLVGRSSKTHRIWEAIRACLQLHFELGFSSLRCSGPIPQHVEERSKTHPISYVSEKHVSPVSRFQSPDDQTSK